MLHTIDLEYEGEIVGSISYNTELKEILVFGGGDKNALNRVRSYMSRERTFTIPTANPEGMDDGEIREDTAKPSDSLMYFELALCELWANTEVWVDWETERKDTT
jgi:hypothetical protein